MARLPVMDCHCILGKGKQVPGQRLHLQRGSFEVRFEHTLPLCSMRIENTQLLSHVTTNLSFLPVGNPVPFRLMTICFQFVWRNLINWTPSITSSGKSELTKLHTDKKKQFGPLVRWLKVLMLLLISLHQNSSNWGFETRSTLGRASLHGSMSKLWGFSLSLSWGNYQNIAVIYKKNDLRWWLAT